jgi:hypothetical protein
VVERNRKDSCPGFARRGIGQRIMDRGQREKHLAPRITRRCTERHRSPSLGGSPMHCARLHRAEACAVADDPRVLVAHCRRSAHMRAAHLLDGSLDAAPVDRLALLALPLAFGSLLRGFQFGSVAKRAYQAPCMVVNCVDVHGSSSLPIEG